MSKHLNYSYLTDFYHLTMAQGYFYSGLFQKEAAFEVFFRQASFEGSYTVLSGVEDIIATIQKSSFFPLVIDQLRKTNLFKDSFLEYLSQFQFKGRIWSLKEGDLIFPQEPIIRVEGNLIETHCLESLILNIFNFQSMITTKSSRIYQLLKEKPFFELGLRRAYGLDGALSSTRASFIGGAKATSNVYAASVLNLPLVGSMSHSWVMSFDSELESFLTFARQYPQSVFLLIDTYDTISQGLPHAIEAFKILLKEGTITKDSLKGVRIDSGDLDYLSKKIRQMLDKNSLNDVKILVSNEIDEDIIQELKRTQSPIDFYGVGTNLVTASGAKPLGGVYKMVAIKNQNQEWEPKIKVSNNSLKTTIPARKNIIRFYDAKNQALADLILLESEIPYYTKLIENKEPIILYDYLDSLKETVIQNYDSFEILLNVIMENGHLLKDFPSLGEVQDHMKKRLSQLHPRYKRTLNPHLYKVGFSKDLISLTKKLILDSKKID